MRDHFDNGARCGTTSATREHRSPSDRQSPFRALPTSPWTLLLLGLAFGSQTAFAQSPTISSIAPQGLKPGSSEVVRVRGANLVGLSRMWTSAPGVKAELVPDSEIADNSKKPAEVAFRVTLAADAPLGVHGLRVQSANGVSNLRLFVIDDVGTAATAKPAKSLDQATAVTLPAAIDSTVDALGRDYVRFSARAGQRLSIEVLGRRLGSPIDPVIRLLTASGKQLTFADDTPGVAPDPQISHTFAEEGDYVVELRDVQYKGGATYAYRLRIGEFPCVTATYPLAVGAGTTVPVGFVGIDGANVTPAPLPGGIAAGTRWFSFSGRTSPQGQSGWGWVELSSSPEVLEIEPNNTAEQAQPVVISTTGIGVNGRLQEPNDTDRFSFSATKGTQWRFTGVTRQQGSPSDLVIKVLKKDGSELAQVDDDGPQLEGTLNVTFPADGEYQLVIEDLNRRGGPQFAYRVAISPVAEPFRVGVDNDTINVPRGGAASVEVSLIGARGKLTEPIEVSLDGAPAGITAQPTTIGPGRTNAFLILKATEQAAIEGMPQLRIRATTKLGDKTLETSATAVTAQRTAFSGLLVPPPSLADQIALGLAPAPLFTLDTEQPGIQVVQEVAATFKVKAAREKDFGEAITLAISPAKMGLPTGITFAPKPIEKGKNEVELTLTAAKTVANGVYSILLLGTGKKGSATTVQPVAGFRVLVGPAFALKADVGDGALEKGKTLTVKVTATRTTAYKGAITLKVNNLPKGVTASAATIAEGSDSAEITLTAAADAAAGEVKNLTVQGDGKAGAVALTATSAASTLTVK